MKNLTKKVLAFTVVAAMFLSGTSVYAGEQLTGVESSVSGPQATVESEVAPTSDTLKAAIPESGPAEAVSLKGAAYMTATTLTYQSTPLGDAAGLYCDGSSAYTVYSVDVKSSGKLIVYAYAESGNSYGTSVVVGTYDGSQIKYWGETGYISPGQEDDGIGNIDVKKGNTYWIGVKSASEATVWVQPYVISSATRTLPAGKIMLAPTKKDNGNYRTCYFKIKPTKSGYIKVTPKVYGTTPSGDITLLNKSKKAVSTKVTSSSSNTVYFGVKKGNTYYLKITKVYGSYSSFYIFGMKFTNVKAPIRSNTKKSKSKKLTRKGSYISTTMVANNKSGNQWYKFKVTKKRTTKIKVDASKVKSGTTKVTFYYGSKKIDSSSVVNGKVNTYTITYSTTYGKAQKGTYYVKIHKGQKANGVYKIRYAQ